MVVRFIQNNQNLMLKIHDLINYNKQMDLQYLFKVPKHSSKQLRCGCYIKHPQSLQIKEKNVMVPLKSINYDIDIVNSLVSLTLVQTYYNPLDKNLEVEYNFPLDPNSCIYKFVAQFGNKRIQGIVKEKQEAKKQYQKAINEGRQAAYGEIDQKSSDIMNLEVGNIPPNTQVTITICILQQLSIAMNSFYKLIIPSTISPRYMNDSEGFIDYIGKPVKSSGKANFTWNFKITLKTNHKVVFFDSPSHKIDLLSQNENATETLIVMAKQCIPNKDFQFLYTTTDFHLPSYVLGRTDQSSTVMLSFIPKFCTMKLDDAYKAQIAHEPFETDMDAAKGEYIFLLDRSGSMGGSRINKAKEALILFLKSLPDDCYFNVISFGGDYESLFDKSSKYDDKTLQTAIKKVEIMQANLGGTEIERPLQKILNKTVQEGYPRQIFLLTDGDVSNTNKVIELVAKNIKYARVHGIGIGSGASSALIKGCADRGKGKAIFISDDDNPASEIIGMLAQVMSPVISQIKLKYNEEQVDSIVPNPKTIPYILKNDVINFYVTFKGQINKKQAFTFSYEDSFNKKPFTSQLIVDPDSQSQPFVDKMSHYKVIKNLERAAKEGIKIEQQMFYVKTTDYKANAIKQSVKHQILSEFTAFICIGKQLIDGEYQQFITKQSQKIKIEQPKLSIGDELDLKCCSASYDVLSSINAQCDMLASLDKNCDMLMQQSQSFSTLSRAKKSSGPGVLSKVGDFFGSLFGGKKEAKPLPQMDKYQQARSLPGNANNLIKCQINCQISNKEALFDEEDEECQQDIMDINEQMEKQQEKEVKKAVIINSNSSKNLLQRVLNAQKSNGSWNDSKILQDVMKLLKDAGIVKVLLSEIKQEIVITYTVAKWLEKNHPEKEYMLLIKKAMNWVKKQCVNNGVDLQKLKQIDTTI